MKKTIRVKYCNYAHTDHTIPNTFNYFVHLILTKYYTVVLDENNPDYIFFHEAAYEHLRYDGVKIFNTGENISPNFNLADYAIGIDYITFEDRYCRLPPYFVAAVYHKDDIELSKTINLRNPQPFTQEELRSKSGFCSFVYSNYLADNRREELLEIINTYKTVNSGGKHLNNVGGPVKSKLGFEMKHKFSMAIENSCRSGYTTDRIINGFMSRTIPIYWGNPSIGKEFNTKRFINCHEYESFDQVLTRIKEIDQNDDLYLEIINEPIFAPGFSFEKTLADFELFLKNIFDQTPKNAKRRTINIAHKRRILDQELLVAKVAIRNDKIKKLLAKLYAPFKKTGFFETFKKGYFRKKLM